MGASSDGRDWCIKALHPADPLTEVRGIPDESAVPSCFVNFQTMATLSPTAGATGTWSAEMSLIPHPVSFMSVSKHDSVAPTTVSEVLNSQLVGVTHSAKFKNFVSQYSRWRLAYCGVTIYQDGPDLANQGTIVVAQKPVQFTQYNATPTTDNGNGKLANPTGLAHIFSGAAGVGEPDYVKPDFDVCQAMPNAYFGKSKEGAYVPLKLTRTHQVWHSLSDSMYQCSGGVIVPFTTGSYQDGQLQIPASLATHATGYWPFYTLNDLLWSAPVIPGPAVFSGDLTSAFCNDVWADICVKNLAVTTSLALFFRFGFECQCMPTSPLSPHLRLSPSLDIQATNGYFLICRELKDGFPADYNDLGKIWEVISGAAKAIAPALAGIPVVGPFLAGGIPMAASAGDAIAGALKRVQPKVEGVGNVASLADHEAAVSAVKAATPAPRMMVVPKRGLRLRRR